MNSPMDPATPVHLTVETAIPAADLLVNLALGLPANFNATRASLKSSTPTMSAGGLGRERFKAYRDLKLPLETHQIDETADV